MSYCRHYNCKNEVYMYLSVEGYIECCMCFMGAKRCNLGELHFRSHSRIPPSKRFYKRSDAIKHLLKHREAGHAVPQYAIRRLKKEIEECGDVISKKEGAK